MKDFLPFLKDQSPLNLMRMGLRSASTPGYSLPSLRDARQKSGPTVTSLAPASIVLECLLNGDMKGLTTISRSAFLFDRLASFFDRQLFIAVQIELLEDRHQLGRDFAR